MPPGATVPTSARLVQAKTNRAAGATPPPSIRFGPNSPVQPKTMSPRPVPVAQTTKLAVGTVAPPATRFGPNIPFRPRVTMPSVPKAGAARFGQAKMAPHPVSGPLNRQVPGGKLPGTVQTMRNFKKLWNPVNFIKKNKKFITSFIWNKNKNTKHVAEYLSEMLSDKFSTNNELRKAINDLAGSNDDVINFVIEHSDLSENKKTNEFIEYLEGLELKSIRGVTFFSCLSDKLARRCSEEIKNVIFVATKSAVGVKDGKVYFNSYSEEEGTKEIQLKDGMETLVAYKNGNLMKIFDKKLEEIFWVGHKE